MKRDARQTWRTVGAALPAVALIGSGAALATTGGGAATAVAAESKPVVVVPAAPLTRPDAPVLPALPPIPEAEAPSLPAAYTTQTSVPAAAANGIPSRALEAYRRGAALVDAADPACGIDWALVAAIGKVESDHGRYAGNGLDETGTVRPGIFGLPLNGNNDTAVIRDTDGGAYDRDPQWDRAVGPMQFIPGTWRAVGVDADGDGSKNPQNMSDAATSTAVYLCSGPGDLTRAGALRSAVLRYNQSDAYVSQVIAIAEGYRRGVSVLPSAELSSDQRTASPYLPSGEQQASAAGAKPGANTPKATQEPEPRPTTTPAATAGPRSTGPAGESGDGGTTPAPSPTSTSSTGVVDTVTGVVKEATKPLGSATSSPSASSSPSPSRTASTLETVKPVTNALGVLVCPAGYEFRLSLDPKLCYPK
jgi:membrane-bound lytic murein transglycosylase B